jgi:hypothetical protein
MSLFSWFFSKKARAIEPGPESAGLGAVDAAISSQPSDRLRQKVFASQGNQSANRKTERLERRELLYPVVRDSMLRAGVLAASYKFKVLSLDAHGLQYLIMMDLAYNVAGDSRGLVEIEATIAHTAKTRHDINVTAVYWRVNEHVTTSPFPDQSISPDASLVKVAQSSPLLASDVTAQVVKPQHPYEPLRKDEVAAFKRALLGVAPEVAPLGQLMTSGPRNPTPVAEFEDTQLVNPEDRTSPLSRTQFGELN